jgi:death-on-curing protein
MKQPWFLSLDDVLAIHEDQLRRYGGARGIRDITLLESALGLPRATFGQEFLHPTLFEMAAAYLFHIARNHPFVDANKRSALACALAFLWMHDIRVEAPEDALYELVIGAAVGNSSKSAIAVFLAEHGAK